MSLFDPLYQIEATGPPTLDAINHAFSEFDGSGTGLMTAKQTVAACKSISNLGFNEQELRNYVNEGLDVAGDGNGRIKTSEFASYLAFEAKKRHKQNNTSTTATTATATASNNVNYVNPFLDFGSDANTTTAPNGNTRGIKITVIPDPNQGTNNTMASEKVDMSASYSPTESDPTQLPDWFGDSLDTITSNTHTNRNANNKNDDLFAGLFGDVDDDDHKQSTQPMHLSMATGDILFEDEDVSSNGSNGHSNGVHNERTLSPRKAQSLKQKHKTNKHSASKSSAAAGLIAPPRAKGDKVPSPKKKKGKGAHGASVSGSLANMLSADVEDDQGSSQPRSARDALRLNKAHSEMAPETTTKKTSTSQATKKTAATTDNIGTKNGPATAVVKKKKRPKIDAIVEMKRGTAMLKYGRRGFPHFRRFQISHDLTKLLWYSRKKSLADTHVAVADMKEILDGQQTEVFKQCTQKTLEKASFSIIHGAKLKSLDVVAKSAEEAALWIKGLKGLIKANQQGKLHKVVQILVDVDFKDITKTKYRTCTDDERTKYDLQHRNRPELVQTIESTLEQTRKSFQSMVNLAATANVQNSSEYENVQTLASEMEQRLEEIEFGLSNKTADLADLKRDVWVLKVDVTVVEEKVKVLSKIKSSIPI